MELEEKEKAERKRATPKSSAPKVSSSDAQGQNLLGKPVKITEFDSCQGNATERILSGKTVRGSFETASRPTEQHSYLN